MSIFHLSSVVIVLTIVACASGAPFTRIVNPFRNSGASSPMDVIAEPGFQNYNPRYDGGIRRSEGTSLDSLSGATFGHNKRVYGNTGRITGTLQERLMQRLNPLNGPVPKRNFDEIDRTNFDSFVKKNNNEIRNENQHFGNGFNFDEIDFGFGGEITNGR